MEMFGDAGIWQAMGEGELTENALFATLQHLPFTTIAVVLSIILISTFFITSADSATFVLGMQTTNGMLNPPLKIKLTWRSEEHTSELQSRGHLVCRLLLEKR